VEGNGSGRRGSLTVVGTGIGSVGRVTIEARSAIASADVVPFLVADPVTGHWVLSLNQNGYSLQSFYAEGRERLDTYHDMIDDILGHARAGKRVCAVFYGHPGVFVYPSHVAIARARKEGLRARMLPAVSAEDCLFADLGVDPARVGCQTYEATLFLIQPHPPNTAAALVLWQVGVIGDTDYRLDYAGERIQVLVDALLQWYPAAHEVAVYEAAGHPIADPRIDWMRLDALSSAPLSATSTLFVPPCRQAEVDRDVLDVLEITAQHVARRSAP
jgi:uncharacterized protein YabN with tetrapyrrole methylase and pyrophosphatase domain